MKKILFLNLITLVLLSCCSIHNFNLKPQYSHLNKVPVENLLSNENNILSKSQTLDEIYSKDLQITSNVSDTSLTSINTSNNIRQTNNLTLNKANNRIIKSNQWEAERKQVLFAKKAITKNISLNDFLSREDIIFWLVVITLVAIILSLLRIDIVSILVVILLILIIILLLQLMGISIQQ